MEHTQEELQELIFGIEPKVLEQEPVYAGFRPTKQRYATTQGVVEESVTYLYPATSGSWGNVRRRELTLILQ